MSLLFKLMIIYNFDQIGTGVGPCEADAILIVDSNAILAFSVAGEFLEPISWWDTQIVEHIDGIELIQFSGSDTPDVLWACSSGIAGVDAIENVRSTSRPEFLDHDNIITRITCYNKIAFYIGITV
jgi:hypothetical protein